MAKIETIQVTRGREGEEPEAAIINLCDLPEWEKNGWAAPLPEPEPTEDPKDPPENPMKVLLKGWTLKRLRRVGVDLNLPEANTLPKPDLIDALLDTGWTPPEDPE